MGESNWCGITQRATCSGWSLEARDRLADAAHDGRWREVLEVLDSFPDLINCSRPGGASRFAPLHQAAHHRAPEDVITSLVERGAFRTLRDANGGRPVDVARTAGASDALLTVLEPVRRAAVSIAALERLESQFHVVILERSAPEVEKHRLRLPELEPVTERALGERFWFAVPGMYGGFAYWLERGGAEPSLMTESWCRVVGGSGQRHAITKGGAQLVAEGFV